MVYISAVKRPGFQYDGDGLRDKSFDEAQEYLLHPILGVRLRECTETVLAVEGCTALGIFGYPDDLKFKSSMTLFEAVASQDSIFSAALGKYFNEERDSRTLELL